MPDEPLPEQGYNELIRICFGKGATDESAG